MQFKQLAVLICLILALAGIGGSGALASVPAADHGSADGHGEQMYFAVTLFFVVCLLLAGRAGAIVSRWQFPSVLGELIAGIAVFNVAMHFGFPGVQQLRDDALVKWVAFVGVVLLLFKTGLEEELGAMLRVGLRAVVVATIGMLVPGLAGYFMSQWFFPEAPLITHIFIGATLVATSVGITAKIFTDLGYETPTKTLVIGAAVIDDILGLVVLAVVSVMADGGSVTVGLVGMTSLKAALFLIGAVVVSHFSAPLVGRLLSRVHTGVGMKQAMALLFCAAVSWAALGLAGLEPIVGAFIAGLVLTPVHFKDFDLSHQVGRLNRWMSKLTVDQGDMREEMLTLKHDKEHSHVEHLIEGIARFFVPVFFVHTGMNVNVAVFGSIDTLLVAAGISLVAVLGKLACGFAAGSANRWVTGWAMVARGEVGLVFATLGHAKGVLSDEVFAVAVVVVVVTTFVPPLILPRLVRQDQERGMDGLVSHIPQSSTAL